MSEAEMAASLLRANNITIWLQTDDCGGMYPSLDSAQGVKLMVHSADAEAANAILAAPVPSTEVTASGVSATSAPQVASSHLKLSLPQIAIGIVTGVMLHLLYAHTKQLGTHTYRYDNNGDGVPDETVVYQNGRYVEQSFDRNFDGALDNWTYYNSEGRFRAIKSDDNFDGRLDSVWHYTNGFLVEARLDTDFNGTTDVTHSYKYDLLKQSDWRPNGTPTVTLRQFFRHGILAEEWRDTNLDGFFDTTNWFDAFQNRIATNTLKLLSSPQP